MKELDIYKGYCLEHNICSEWLSYWKDCKSLKDYMIMALRISGVKWLCDSISQGWGIPPTLISNKFNRYINGRYVFTIDDYDSEMYCRYDGDIKMRSDVLCLIDVKGEVSIPSGVGCHIYICGDSEITLTNGENSRIICYICDYKSNVINNSKANYNERK